MWHLNPRNRPRLCRCYFCGKYRRLLINFGRDLPSFSHYDEFKEDGSTFHHPWQYASPENLRLCCGCRAVPEPIDEWLVCEFDPADNSITIHTIFYDAEPYPVNYRY